MYKNIALSLFAFLSFFSVNAWAWNDKYTHKDLSKKAAEYSDLSLGYGDYLQKLGFTKNLEEQFVLNSETKTVKEWIGEGGVEEDAGNVFTAYYYNHFHDPTKSWDQWNQAGLSTYYPGINGKSSILWALDASNEWSWQKAREYYSLALTSSTETQRSEYFASTFKGLGHMIHLIQDAAQPAHVRNDPHPLDDKGIIPGFEHWAKTNHSQVLSLMSSPESPSVSLNTSLGGYVPITQFFDTDQYNGTNPSNSKTIGIAEYTNANFFSENTVFSFPYPAWSSVGEYEAVDESSGDAITYLRKTGDGEAIEHLAAGRWYYKYLPTSYKTAGWGLKLDDQCYSDYASLLIPRAVGYSAGLINYFFRGKMEMYEDTENLGTYIIENKSGEKMEQGTFRLFYDDDQGNRTEIKDWSLYGQKISLDASGDSSKIKGIKITLPSTLPEDDKYMLVFNGKLGEEEGAVIAKKSTFKPYQFRFRLYRADGVKITPSMLISAYTEGWDSLSFDIVDSQRISQGDGYVYFNDDLRYDNLRYDNEVDCWVIETRLGSGNYWIRYSTDFFNVPVTTQYPGKVKKDQQYQEADLLSPTEVYEDTVPYVKIEAWNDVVKYTDGFTATIKVWSSIPYTVRYTYFEYDHADTRYMNTISTDSGHNITAKTMNVPAWPDAEWSDYTVSHLYSDEHSPGNAVEHSLIVKYPRNEEWGYYVGANFNVFGERAGSYVSIDVDGK